MASIEIKSNETFSYYPGSLKDIDANRALVSYEDNWKPDEWVPLENVRTAAAKFDPTTFQPLPGQTVEAMAKSSENEPYSWWQAVVKNVRGEFYFISYSAFDDTFNEILEKDMLRPFNSNPSLKFSDFTKLEIPLPRELWDSVSNSQFQQLRDTTGCLSLHVDHNKHVVVVLGQPANVKRVKLLATMTLKHLVELQRLQAKTLTKRAEIDQLETRQKQGVVEEFKCDPAIMGLVIGKKGKNIKNVEAQEGVMKVRVDSVKGVVNILAKDQECARRARAMLEFVDQRFPIPASSVGRIVGKNFTNIRDIERNSGVVRIKVGDDDDQGGRSSQKHGPDDMIDLVIVGTRESVSDAVILLEQHINFLKNYSQLAEEDRTLSDKISQLAMDVGPVGRRYGQRRAPDGEDEADYDRSERRAPSGRGRGRGGYESGRGGAESGRGGYEPGRGGSEFGRGRGRGGGRGRGRGGRVSDNNDDVSEEPTIIPISDDSGRGRGGGGRGRGRGRGARGNGAPREKEEIQESSEPSDRPPRDSRARRTDEDKDVNEASGENKPKKSRPQPRKQPEYKPVEKKSDGEKKEASNDVSSGDKSEKKEKSDDNKDKKPRNHSRPKRERQEASSPDVAVDNKTVAKSPSPSPPPAASPAAAADKPSA